MFPPTQSLPKQRAWTTQAPPPLVATSQLSTMTLPTAIAGPTPTASSSFLSPESRLSNLHGGQGNALCGSKDLLAVAGHTPPQERYRQTIRDLADALEKTGAVCADDLAWKQYLSTVPPEERFNEGSARKLKFELQKGLKDGRCPFCWVLREACYCADLPELPTTLNFAMLYHPGEFFRASSTGKMVPQILGGEFLMYGFPGHRGRIDEILQSPNTYVLFPDENAVTLADITSGTEAAGHSTESAMTPPPPRSAKDITILVLDGTWGQARALFSMISKKSPGLKKLRLDMKCAEAHTSLFSALRKQSEAGRVSTFEACMLLVEEAGYDTKEMEGVMKRMVSCLSFEKHRPSPFEEVGAKRQKLSIEGHRRRSDECAGIPRIEKRGIKRTTDLELETWIVLLQRAAIAQPPPIPVIRRCCYCNMWLIPARMYEHVRGRNHCQTVAKAHLGRKPGKYVAFFGTLF